jgi:hypothetical protein
VEKREIIFIIVVIHTEEAFGFSFFFLFDDVKEKERSNAIHPAIIKFQTSNNVCWFI